MTFGPPPSVYTQSALAADHARRRRRGALLGVLALLLAAALGTGVWLLVPAGDGRTAAGGGTAGAQAPDEIRETVEKVPASAEGRLVIEHSEKDLAEADEDHPVYAPGTWATDRIFAKGVANRIVGLRINPPYDETAWTLKLGGHICATSEHVTADGRTAVVIQPPKPKGSATDGVCDQLVLVDLDTGRKVWQRKMPAADFAYVTHTNLTLTEGVVAVAWGHGSVAYDMRSGKRLWNTGEAGCVDTGFGGGRALLALVRCGQGPDATYKVQKLTPRTGRPQWTYKVAAGVQDVYLPSSDPPVLAVAAGDSQVTDLITLDGEGRHLATVSMQHGRYAPRCGDRLYGEPYFGLIEACDGLVVGRNQLYLTAKDQVGEGPENWIVAFDLRTGKAQGKFDGRSGQTVLPLRMSGDDLLIYRRSPDTYGPAAVVLWNPHTDRETPFLLFMLPDDEEGGLSDPEQSEILVEHGRVFFAKRELVRDDKHPTVPVLEAVGIGSAGLKH
ncbi:outer membrane protein assembly factor BamB family protein [Streptomyces sp. YIM S03343]